MRIRLIALASSLSFVLLLNVASAAASIRTPREYERPDKVPATTKIVRLIARFFAPLVNGDAMLPPRP